ncbi:hypothetical protein SAVIM338S_06415 [Streptomyces avidinii]
MDHGTDAPDRLTLIEAPVPCPAARIVALRGAVNWWDEPALRAALARARTPDRLPLVVDLGSLEHADAILLGLLLATRTRGPLHLVGPLSRTLHRRLDITGTRDAFRIHPNLTAALAAITAADAPGG